MGEEELSPRLRFRPWPPGDPGPEIWQIIRELEMKQQREIAGIVLRTQIGMEEVRIGGLKQIAGLLAPGAR
jgi:hypothetical protein